MAQVLQEEGWPLGLQPLNVRVNGLHHHHNHNHNHLINIGSLSFNTLLTDGSPLMSSSTDSSSSDLDTESTTSFVRDRSITLGSLIGISSGILELSRRSTRGSRIHEPVRNKKRCYKTRTWFLSLCSRLGPDAVSMSNNNTPSLGHFLEAERKAAANNNNHNNTYRRTSYASPGNFYGPDDDFSRASEANPLFVEGNIAPPQSSSALLDSNSGRALNNRDLLSHADEEPSLLLSCLCGTPGH